MRTGSYSLEPARSYPPEARRSSSERSSALRPPGERSRPSQREFPKPVREQQPDSSAPELPLLAEMCNTGSQLVKNRELFSQLQKLGSIAAVPCSPERPPHGLFPAPKAGLHCGSTTAWLAGSLTSPFSQLQKLGSIAASTPTTSLRSRPRLFPAPKAGLHCGAFLLSLASSGEHFSQLQKLGSIAASTPTTSLRSRPPFPSSKSWAPLRPG